MVTSIRQGVAVLLTYGHPLRLAGPPSARTPSPRRTRRSPRPGWRCSPAATWRARRPASAWPRRRCSTSPRRRPPPDRSPAPTTRSTPIGGMALLTGMMLGEVSPGGAGAGMYTILAFAIIAVFIGGLMVGRTPEYLGKKIQAREVKLAGLLVLVMPMLGAHPHGHRRLDPCRTGRSRERRAARLHRDPLRLHVAGQQQRLRLRRPDRQHALLQHHQVRRVLLRALRRDGPGARARRRARRQEGRPRGAGTFRTDSGCSSDCSSASSCSSGRSCSSRPSPSGRSSSSSHHGKFYPDDPHRSLRPAAPSDPSRHRAARRRRATRPVRPRDPRASASSAPSRSWTRGSQVKNPVMFVVLVGTIVSCFYS